jgi:Putative restriction endonuclease
MSVPAGLLTVGDFLKIAEPREGHIELHHGEVVVMPPPRKGHQKIQDRLHTLLKQLFADEYVVRIEMAFARRPNMRFGRLISVALLWNGTMPPVTTNT